MRRRLQELSLTLPLALAGCAQPFVPGDRGAARWQLDVSFEDSTKGKVFAGDCVRAK